MPLLSLNKELHAACPALVNDRTAAKNRGRNITQPLFNSRKLGK